MESYMVVLVATALSLILLKIQKLLLPKQYFYFGKLIEGFDDNISLIGLLFRTSIPVLAGFFVGFFSLTHHFPRFPEVYGAVVGFLTAFMLIWPDIYNPSQINPIYSNKKSKLFILHFMVLALFTLLGFLGGKFALTFIQLFSPTLYAQILNWIDPKAIVSNLVSNLFWVILCLAFIKVFHKRLHSFQSINNNSDQSGTAKRVADAP